MTRRWLARLVLTVWATAGMAAASIQIRGVVVDSSGLAVPGATVEL